MAFDAGLADRVRSLLSGRSGLSEMKMFGGLAFMIHGHMCCGIVKTDLMLRLAEERVAAALERPHTRPMDFSGKPMKSMLFVTPQGTVSDEDLSEWVDAAVSFARTLPPKAAKARRAAGRQGGLPS